MSPLDINISISKIKNYSGKLDRRMPDKTFILSVREFSLYIMNLYGRLIEEAIYSNRYKGEWEPVHDEGYKEFLGVDPEGDILVLIKEALEVKKMGTNFVVRINPKIKYPGSKLPLVKVLRAIDRGTTKFNARPLFNPILRDIRSHILDLWRGYLKIKNIV